MSNAVAEMPVVSLDKVKLGNVGQDDSAIVVFRKGGSQYIIRVYSACDPVRFASYLKECREPGQDAGEITTEFLRSLRDTTKATMIDVENYSLARYFYHVTMFDKPCQWNIGIFTRSENESKPAALFTGTLIQFWTYINNYRDPSDLSGHVVKFYYEAGTVPGNRIVKVESVDRLGGNVLIRGLDVMKEEFRSFRADRIRGAVILVN
jgi:hypothetical protein